MTAPRLEIDLDKIRHNASVLVDRLAPLGIAVAGVTKAGLGSRDIAGAMLGGGVTSLADSRIENLESMRRSGVVAPLLLIRSPMVSTVHRVVRCADASCNTEMGVIAALASSAAAQGRRHGIVLMVELGDLREGIMPSDLLAVARETVRFPSLDLEGIGTNLACQSGVMPDARNMAELSSLADDVESDLGSTLEIVSGGNSANLEWALSGVETGRINQLRLGEAILLGREPLRRQPIANLHTDAFTLVAEVIESKIKPSRPWGTVGQAAFGDVVVAADIGTSDRTILALGRQDTDHEGLESPTGVKIIGASSDHLITTMSPPPPVGTEVHFGVNYSALVRAMTSPFVEKVTTPAGPTRLALL